MNDMMISNCFQFEKKQIHRPKADEKKNEHFHSLTVRESESINLKIKRRSHLSSLKHGLTKDGRLSNRKLIFKFGNYLKTELDIISMIS